MPRIQSNTATVTDTLIVGLGMNGEIDYGSFESLNIQLGAGSDVITIESTHQRMTMIATGAGNDVVNAESKSANKCRCLSV
ncbi:hypothetical protein [Anabaena sp. UHCC 0399]|uniref:hypothetical protein n=1 Tax=Anabaena sp. UHCC 0399 TaxID=3110238 RepID=UPI002B1FBD88|nr:hypothetical protein [Anabaena sp. UHCC 0399]MEA5564369.1 hypothetical protein [Anabaena sp. UHCC 0399]